MPRTDLVRACLREPVSRTPVWFMRQAGRALPEYRAARGTGSILAAIGDAPLSAELTLQPVRRYGVDAAILFSDIVVPLHAIGFGVDVEPGRGPVVAEPFRSEADLARLRPFEPAADAPYVAETVGLVRRELAGIGRGADRLRRRALHRGQLRRRGRALPDLRQGQGAHARRPRPVAAADRAAGRHGGGLAPGADRGRRPGGAALRQLGRLALARRVRPLRPARPPAPSSTASPTSACRPSSSASAPASCWALMGSAGSDVVGVDWRVPLDEARRRIGAGRAVQGNLDPALCLAPWPVVADATRTVLADARRTGPAPATSSTWVTASCPRRTRASWPPSSSWSTRRPRGHDDGRPAHGARHAGEHGGDRTLLHADPPRPPADARAAGRARGALRRHRRRVAAGRPHRRRRSTPCAPRSRRARPAATWWRSAPSTPSRSSRRPPPPWAPAGVERVIGLVLTPHGSSLGSQEYLDRAAAALGDDAVRARRAVVRRTVVRRAARRTRAGRGARRRRAGRTVIFTAHSLPERIRETGDTYPEQLAESARLVATAAGLDDWLVAWQSAGRTPEPWLGPDVRDVVRQLGRRRRGRRRRRLPDRLRGRPPRGALRPRHRAGRRRGGAVASPTRAPHRSTTTPPSSPRWPT